ncbi:hypothetical protein CR513_08984, partial [Mucuna pruriens]
MEIWSLIHNEQTLPSNVDCAEEDESLHSFMEHFLVVAIKIKDLNLKVALHSNDRGTKTQIPMQEAVGLDGQVMSKGLLLHPRGGNGGIPRWRCDKSQKGKRNPKPTDRQEKYGGRRCMETQILGLHPNHKHGSSGDEKSKYYQYNRNYGHTTKACRTLKDKIEELVQVGHLRKFVKRGIDWEHPKRELETNHRRREMAPKAEGTSRLRGVINIIVGGFVGGSTSLARKRYLRAVNNVHLEANRVKRKLPPITFTG